MKGVIDLEFHRLYELYFKDVYRYIYSKSNNESISEEIAQETFYRALEKIDDFDEKIDEIIEFSELGAFIDRPVQTYSSGMYSKLAFSITAILETEIMLIDEVLSVGDAKFKKKSYEKMKSLIDDKDRTVIIVSHSTDTLKNLCDNILWIHDGEMKMMGPTEEVLPKYNEFMS